MPESEEVRRGTEALPAEGPMLDVLGLFMCPLTMEVMRDPVITADGKTLSERKYSSGLHLERGGAR